MAGKYFSNATFAQCASGAAIAWLEEMIGGPVEMHLASMARGSRRAQHPQPR